MSELKELGYTFGKAHDPRQGWVHRLTGMPGRESQSTVEREPVEPFAPVPVMPVTPVEPDGPRLRESEQVGRLFDLPARERSGRDGTPAIYREAA